jgi:hypothetical protein
MNAVLKHWQLIIALAAAIYFYGSLVERVTAVEQKASLIEQMARDIAVMKYQLEVLYRQQTAKGGGH